MHDCWVAGLTISGWKMSIGMPGIDIVGILCDQDGWRLEPKKVQWILDWPMPKTLKDAHAFIGIVIYYHIFILDFMIITSPIFPLFWKGKLFKWTEECKLAMDALKSKITEASVLVTFEHRHFLLSFTSTLVL